MTPGQRPATRYGLFLGQAGVGWDELVERFVFADRLGFDHAFLVDHLMPTDPPFDRPILEAWTSLAGLATATRRVGLGILVSSITFRHPAVLAKEAVTVDHISNGRLILGIGIGWFAEEHARFGFEFPPAQERIARLEEAIEIVEAMQGGQAATVQGATYRLEEAKALPRPMQRPRIPLLIAAHRPRMLRLAARRADIWDTFATTPGTATDGLPADLGDRVTRFEAACREAGRDPVTVRRSTWVGGEAFETELAYRSFVERHRALGFTDLVAALPPAASWDVVRRVATDVIPRLREQEASSQVQVPS